MLRLIIWLLLGYIGYRVIKTLMAPKKTDVPSHGRDSEETVQDPVCKVYLSKQDAIVGTLDGKRHYFCSMNCLEKFRDTLDDTKKT